MSIPSRQLWLASLGGTALTVRGILTVWLRLVAEGEVAERWLLGPRPAAPER